MPSDAGSHAPSHAPSSQPYTPSYNPSTYNPRESRDPYGRRESRDTSTHRERIERLTTVTRPQPQPQPQPQTQPQPQHIRNDSIVESAADYPEPQHATNGRRHDYDVQAMESDLSPRSAPTKNPIPAPTVSIRSEFPTLNRSRQQQSLACLITVEIPEGNWSPDAEDLRQSSGGSSVPQDEPYGIMRFPTVRTSRSSQFEPQENLDEVAEDLRTRVDNWHGLEFNRYERISCSITNWTMLTIVNFADLASCVSTAICVSGKTVNHGRNWNATCSLRCSFVSRKSGPLTVTINTMIRCPNQNLLGAPSRVPFSSRSTSDPSKGYLVSSINKKKKKKKEEERKR